ncbi:putative soluble lytic murein transglycosylase [Selenomonas ruminantium subsp. lactilytica TAM6421]|uniref:Putative soluble lytic murein transglycosylase n=1 Tax=Selenomonas ruminantium subsp. lactilytica (strain NBRC 103574 / TAM6421) TaxID=927704 RepID=I0GQJ2_SELRL|nr:lytic transglycosylase domain-containing protein [Selenomonas ruminantium]BAL83029.1 putative soluble lytic murein transglycosylase [Selenomonas ruminantium subsp. lactilytica TAM6421]
MLKRLLMVLVGLMFLLGEAVPAFAYDDKTIVYGEVAGRIGESDEAAWITDAILYAGAVYGVDPLLLASVMEAESGFTMASTSSAGAYGYMQLMPETAASLGVDRYNPLENVLGGASYLRQQMDHFAGDGEYGLTEAVGAYNAGGGAVEKYGGVPPYAETINYVARIADIYGKLLQETNL